MSNPFMPGKGSLLEAYFNASHKPRFEIYEDAKEPINKWRWRIWMSSDIVGASTQGYSTRTLCLTNVKSLGNHIKELESTGKLV
ncbi:MAG: hypothetical protein ABI685_09625 [Ferruginibacter sp.]